MKRLGSILCVGLLASLAALSSGCSSTQEDATEQDGAIGGSTSAAERKSLAKLLAGGEISGATLDGFISPEEGIAIVHHLDEVKTVDSAYAGAPTGEEPALDLLRTNIAEGVAGAVKDLGALPTYSCEAKAYGAPGEVDAQGLYLVPIDGAKFDLLTSTILDAAEATGRDGTDLGLRFAEIEAKITFAAFLPARHTTLFFGREADARGKKKVWRIYAADVTTPKCEGPQASLPSGTIDGKAFVPTDGAAYTEEDMLHLSFSTASNTCQMFEDVKFDAGATYVQVFELEEKLGTSHPGDVKIVTIAPSCSPGMLASAGTSYYEEQVAGGTEVTLTRIDSVVEGTVSATFANGSTFKGSFSIPRCTGFAWGGEARCR